MLVVKRKQEVASSFQRHFVRAKCNQFLDFDLRDHLGAFPRWLEVLTVNSSLAPHYSSSPSKALQLSCQGNIFMQFIITWLTIAHIVLPKRHLLLLVSSNPTIPTAQNMAPTTKMTTPSSLNWKRRSKMTQTYLFESMVFKCSKQSKVLHCCSHTGMVYLCRTTQDGTDEAYAGKQLWHVQRNYGRKGGCACECVSLSIHFVLQFGVNVKSRHEPRCVIHFYHSKFKRCEIMDKHLSVCSQYIIYFMLC